MSDIHFRCARGRTAESIDVVPSAIALVHPFHRSTQVGVRRLEGEVVMVVHDTVGMDDQSVSFAGFADQLNNVFLFGICGEHSSSFEPSMKNVIPAIFSANSQCSCHNE